MKRIPAILRILADATLVMFGLVVVWKLANGDGDPPSPRDSSPVSRELARFTNSIGMVLSWIPAGDAEAGGGAKLPEERARSGGIATGFWLGRTEVTQGQYREVMGSAPSRFSGSDLPVESVSWVDATEFCRRLGAREGRTYRLPTEVEWEYACRAGTRTAFGFGDDDTWLGEFAWYDASSGFETHPVGTRKPNAWGFYDMHGNVWEWCLDPYPGEGGVSSGPAGDAAGGSGSLRVRRGGAWYNRPVFCRSSRRDFDRENRRDAGTGFRIVWEVEQGGPGA